MAKFCTQCGRPLVEGKVCECQRQTQQLQDEPWRNQNYQPPWQNTQEERKPIEFNSEKAVNVWINFKNRVGIGEPETNGENYYERGKKIVPECIKANEGEIPIRQYKIAKLRTLHKLHWAEGKLQVTNKRVIFRAPGRSIMGRTVLQHEFAIDEIAGVEARKDPAFGFLEFLLAYVVGAIGMYLGAIITAAIADSISFLGGFVAIALLIAGNIPFFIIHKRFLLKSLTSGVAAGAAVTLSLLSDMNGFVCFINLIAILLWWACCIINSFRRNLVFTIKTKGATGAIEIRRKKKNGLLGFLFRNAASEKEEYTGFSNVFPMEDTEKAIREIGAMISDIQKLGDYGIEKWKED